MDACAKPVEEFFSELSMPYIKSVTQSGLTLYSSEDDTIRIYVCDIFDFNSSVEGQFDAMWDVCAMVALSPGELMYTTSLLHTYRTITLFTSMLLFGS